MGGNPSPCQPCGALRSRQTSHSCGQFATPLLLLEFSPGDLAAPSVFGLSVLLFKVRRRRPSTHTPGPPCCRRRCLRPRLHHSVLPSTTPGPPRLHPALHARVRLPSLAHPQCRSLVPSWCPPRTLLVPSSNPPRTLLPVCLRADVRHLDGPGGSAARDTLGHRPAVRRRESGPLHVCNAGLEPQTSRPEAGLLLLQQTPGGSIADPRQV